MKVLDGRNAHKVPQVIEISSFLITSKWRTDTDIIYCLQLDGMLVPCVSTLNKPTICGALYTLCGAYKTERGFNSWLKRFYPEAKKEV